MQVKTLYALASNSGPCKATMCHDKLCFALSVEYAISLISELDLSTTK